ncbi:MAG: S8 family serine peptidase [Pseudomonadota bacterium]|nr:S8 family serine peptidase [Pseudomonadota bacterium]
MSKIFFFASTILFSLVFSLVFSLTSYGSELIVKFKPGINPRKQFVSAEPLFPDLNIYLVESKMSWQSLTKDPTVAYAQPNHKITRRSRTPNDAEFSSQWSLQNSNKAGADIGATLAWTLGVGGKDPLGNDIVVAIVDGGVDISHPDLLKNIWTNQNETADNGIDDDGNGYIDDIHGWDVGTNSGTIAVEEHGTHVAGIAGARGNNKMQVTGVNWEVKLMAVSIPGDTDTTAAVIKAYGYVTTQKKLWSMSRGTKGANVVTTNSSFGIDGGDCKSNEFKVWNDLYNEMGKYGILSAGATANMSIDVDVEGDVPTGCTSPYIIAVTNTTELDELNFGAAYGKTSVDLGAPGTDVLSTIRDGELGVKSGTSMATPHVAGGVGLLHHLMSKKLAELFISKPAEAALKLKDLLLNTVDPIVDLKNVTVSGGRLNIYKAGLKANVWK